MAAERDQDVREELIKLREEHRALDCEIFTLETASQADQLLITRLKRRKLKLKDQIQALESRLLPDIIA